MDGGAGGALGDTDEEELGRSRSRDEMNVDDVDGVEAIIDEAVDLGAIELVERERTVGECAKVDDEYEEADEVGGVYASGEYARRDEGT